MTLPPASLSAEPFPGSLALDAAGRRLLPDVHARRIAAAFDVARLPPGFHADPYPVYQALLEYAPVHRMAEFEISSVWLNRFAGGRAFGRTRRETPENVEAAIGGTLADGVR